MPASFGQWFSERVIRSPRDLMGSMGGMLAAYLSTERADFVSAVRPDPIETIRQWLEPGDVLLIEGRTRFSVGIKYLTQSTWSHAACYVGPVRSASPAGGDDANPPCVVEADVVKGVIVVPLTEYEGVNIRICRPRSLNHAQHLALREYLVSRVGDQYDLRNVFDLARWLLPTPPIPARWRRRMIAFGSGDPTRAICSTLIAQAFQSIRYPILPLITEQRLADCVGDNCSREILRIRHHSLFTPRDFDLSPYFDVIKPRLEGGFDAQALQWAVSPVGEAAA